MKELRFGMANTESRFRSFRESMEGHRGEGHGEKKHAQLKNYGTYLRKTGNNIITEPCHKLITSFWQRCARVILPIIETNNNLIYLFNCMFNCVLYNYDVPVL